MDKHPDERSPTAPRNPPTRGQNLDLTDDPRTKGSEPLSVGGRRFVGIHFVCCGAYARVYVNRDDTAYEGSCPRCGKKVRLVIGPGGTDARFFSAG
jgi:hypothetical protein